MNLTPAPGAHISRVSIVIPAYRDADRAIALVLALQQQRLPPNVAMDIVVVDDGSGDGGPDRIEAIVGGDVALIRLAQNSGRAFARNAGAHHAQGDVILFMDCDCLPAHDDLIALHVGAWEADAVATIGPVTGNGEGFWHRYQAAASERRARQHAAGINFGGTGPNLMVSRAAFLSCGGFDIAYRTYGFEDRDLQMRLAARGRIAWAACAGVRHMDTLTLSLVCSKMVEGGGAAAIIFSGRYPDAYRTLGYAALDTRLQPWLRLPARMLGCWIEPLARWSDRLIANPSLPYFVKVLLAKSLSGASFLVGTARITH